MPQPSYTGVGGRTRDDKTMNTVDKIAGDTGKPAAPVHPAATIAAKAAPLPSSYAPTAVAGNSVQSRVYGSPIEGNAASK
jgi:hypothetical protein